MPSIALHRTDSEQDVEAQQNSVHSQRNNADAPRPEYALAGRGGAGNYMPTATAAAAATPGDLSTSTKQGNIPESGYAGRGGAGNFRGDATEKMKLDIIAREREADEKAYEETVKDVEQGLKPPQKAHLSGDKLGDP